MATKDELIDAKMSEIFSDDSFNSRGAIDSQSVAILAKSLNTEGLIQPIIIQPYALQGLNFKWRIVCGHRRHAAAGLLGWDTIKAIVKEGLTEEAALTINVSENVKRKDLNMLEEAYAIKRFREMGWNDTKVANKLGVSNGWVAVRFRLLELPPDIQQRAAAGFLTQHQVNDIAALPTRELMYAACRKAIDFKLKGERGSLKVGTKRKNIFKKGPARTREEIFEMQDHIQTSLRDQKCFAARCLAWAGGVISDFDLRQDIEREATERGFEYDSLGMISAEAITEDE